MFSGEFPGNLSELSPSNLAWVEELYYAYRRDPSSVDEAWRREFERMDGGPPPPPTPSNGNGLTNGNNGHLHTAPDAAPYANGHAGVAELIDLRGLSGAAAEIATVAAERALGG
jgi:2-oxoglutarate dehydrogenase complex dehydrogenase (E1) component-like enzyme